MSNRKNAQHSNHWLGKLFLTILCLSLIACGGGISGTGDGGPIVIVDNAENTTGNGGNATDGAADSMGVPASTEQQTFPSILHTEFNATLLEGSTIDTRFTALSSLTLSQKLASQFREVQRQSLQTVQHLATLETLLTDTLVQCDATTTCDTFVRYIPLRQE